MDGTAVSRTEWPGAGMLNTPQQPHTVRGAWLHRLQFKAKGHETLTVR